VRQLPEPLPAPATNARDRECSHQLPRLQGKTPSITPQSSVTPRRASISASDFLHHVADQIRTANPKAT